MQGLSQPFDALDQATGALLDATVLGCAQRRLDPAPCLTAVTSSARLHQGSCA